MRVLIAPTSFGASLTAQQAGEAIAAGWAEQSPSDVLTTCPLSDGGTGFIDAVLAARGGDLVPVTVTGPRGDQVPATVLSLRDDDGTPTAFIEAEQACGPHLVDVNDVKDVKDADAWRATSVGVGQLVQAAVDDGARRVIIGIGDSASHDAGAGLLAGLGVGDPARLTTGGGVLSELSTPDLDGLAGARERLRGVDLVVATATDLPLLGFHGASATDAVRRGASPEQAQQLESAFGHFADMAQRALVAGRPVGGSGLAAVAGAGAGGGLGFALMLLGARQANGVQVVLEATACLDRVRSTDLVVTGERRFDWDSLRGGVVVMLAARALAMAVPTIVIALEVEVGRRETLNLGVSGAYSVADRAGRLADVLADPSGAVTARTRRVARTWSP